MKLLMGVAIVLVVGCVSVPPTRVSQLPKRSEFDVRPWTFEISQDPEVLVPIAAQKAAELGLELVEVEKEKGVLKVKSRWVDEWACDAEWAKALDKRDSGHDHGWGRNDPQRPIISRVFEVTSVLAGGRATVSAVSKTCAQKTAGKLELCGWPAPVLVQQELDAFRAIGKSLQGVDEQRQRVLEGGESEEDGEVRAPAPPPSK